MYKAERLSAGTPVEFKLRVARQATEDEEDTVCIIRTDIKSPQLPEHYRRLCTQDHFGLLQIFFKIINPENFTNLFNTFRYSRF